MCLTGIVSILYIIGISVFALYNNLCKIWGYTYPTNINSILILQKRVIRIMYGAIRLNNKNSLYPQLLVLQFLDFIYMNMLLFMYKAYNRHLPPNTQRLFVRRETMYSLRASHGLEKLSNI